MTEKNEKKNSGCGAYCTTLPKMLDSWILLTVNYLISIAGFGGDLFQGSCFFVLPANPSGKSHEKNELTMNIERDNNFNHRPTANHLKLKFFVLCFWKKHFI